MIADRLTTTGPSPIASVFKVCVIGASGVGKTSLVRRLVERTFAERIPVTPGVAIARMRLTVIDPGGVIRPLTLVLWDLQGDGSAIVRLTHLRGAAGYALVTDGTDRERLAGVQALRAQANAVTGGASSLVLLNKSDLATGRDDADDADALAMLRPYVRTSARDGAGVEEAFRTLAASIVAARLAAATA